METKQSGNLSYTKTDDLKGKDKVAEQMDLSPFTGTWKNFITKNSFWICINILEVEWYKNYLKHYDVINIDRGYSEAILLRYSIYQKKNHRWHNR